MYDSRTEQAALASIIRNPAEGQRAIHKHYVTVDSFYLEPHKIIFEVIQTMMQLGEKLTPSSIWSRVAVMGDMVKNSELTAIVKLNEDRPMNWCDLLRKYTLARNSLAIMGDAKKRLKNVFNAETVLTGLTEDMFQMLMATEVEDEQDDVEDLLSKAGVIPFGWKGLNDVVTGMPVGAPTLIGARPGVGKTTFALSQMLKTVLYKRDGWFKYRDGQHGAFFSLEMSRKAILRKATCMISGIDENDVRKGVLNKTEKEAFRAHYAVIQSAPFVVYDRSNAPNQICTNMRFASEKFGTTIFVLDYFQRLRSNYGQRKDREFFSTASNMIADTLKNLSTESAMIILSQLLRDCEIPKDLPPQKRWAFVPTSKHFKETGALEEDAFLLGTLYPHPDFCHLNVDKQQLILDWHKNRGGDMGRNHLIFHRSMQRFGEPRAKKIDYGKNDKGETL
jgi:replicative DNA helicase